MTEPLLFKGGGSDPLMLVGKDMIGKARSDHPETAKLSQVKTKPISGKARKMVYEYLRLCKQRGATDEEIQKGCDLNPSTERPRRIELVEMGLAEPSGMTRKTSSNRNAIVWTATSERPLGQ